MAFSTVYDVKVRYSVDDRAGRSGLSGLKNETRALAKETSGATSMFTRLGGAVAGYFGARAAGGALVGFNATVQDTKLQIAGMLSLVKKTDLKDQIGAADGLFARLQRRASTLPGTTMEYVKMAGMLTQPLTDAGLTMKDLEDLTVNAVVAAKGLGEQWQVAARDIDQAMRGQYHSTDPFSGKVLGSIGYKGEEGRERYNALNADKRASEYKRALLQKQFSQLGDAQGQTFSGAFSTLQDTFEQVVGKIGLPLFQAITAEIKGWNKWLDAHSDQVNQIAHSLGEGLVKGFVVIKDALGFLVAHADTLLAIGKVYAMVKIGGMAGRGIGAIGGAGSSLKDKLGWFRGQSDGFDADGNYQHTKAGAGRSAVGGLKGAAANAGLLLGTALTAYEVGTMLGLDEVGHGLAKFTGLLSKETIAFEKLERGANALEESLQRAAKANPDGVAPVTNLQGIIHNKRDQANLYADLSRAMMAEQNDHSSNNQNDLRKAKAALEAAGLDVQGSGRGMPSAIANMMRSTALGGEADMLTGKSGAMGAAGFIAFNAGITQLTDYQRQTLDETAAQTALLGYVNQSLTKGIPIDPATVMTILRGATGDPTGTHKPMSDKPKVNIHIARIEVQSDDPDRMAFGLVEAFRDAAKNPSSAVAALREG